MNNGSTQKPYEAWSSNDAFQAAIKVPESCCKNPEKDCNTDEKIKADSIYQEVSWNEEN